jgi:hypothetical protein
MESQSIKASVLSPIGGWVTPDMSMYVYDTLGKYRRNALLTASSSDSVGQFKAMAAIAFADINPSVVLGAPSTLARYRFLWCNSVISEQNGKTTAATLVRMLHLDLLPCPVLF